MFTTMFRVICSRGKFSSEDDTPNSVLLFIRKFKKAEITKHEEETSLERESRTTKYAT